jgi:hypothetical protein
VQDFTSLVTAEDIEFFNCKKAPAEEQPMVLLCLDVEGFEAELNIDQKEDAEEPVAAASVSPCYWAGNDWLVTPLERELAAMHREHLLRWEEMASYTSLLRLRCLEVKHTQAFKKYGAGRKRGARNQGRNFAAIWASHEAGHK